MPPPGARCAWTTMRGPSAPASATSPVARPSAKAARAIASTWRSRNISMSDRPSSEPGARSHQAVGGRVGGDDPQPLVDADHAQPRAPRPGPPGRRPRPSHPPSRLVARSRSAAIAMTGSVPGADATRPLERGDLPAGADPGGPDDQQGAERHDRDQPRLHAASIAQAGAGMFGRQSPRRGRTRAAGRSSGRKRGRHGRVSDANAVGAKAWRRTSRWASRRADRRARARVAGSVSGRRDGRRGIPRRQDRGDPQRLVVVGRGAGRPRLVGLPVEAGPSGRRGERRHTRPRRGPPAGRCSARTATPFGP